MSTAEHMRYIYLDESVFSKPNDHIGYGALITNAEIENHLIEKALNALKNDPDRNIEPAKKLDTNTFDRGFFHASEDSKNAHSHFCTVLNEYINGEFSCNFFDINVNEALTNEGAYDLSSKLSILKGLITREPITIVFEERNGLTLDRLKMWWAELNRELLMTAYEQPWNPLYFPKVEFKICGKNEPGLQFVDFLLWSTSRNINGNGTWFDRIQSLCKSSMNQEGGGWGGVDITLGSFNNDPDSFYQASDFPNDFDKSIDKNKLYNFLVHAQKVINNIHVNVCPDEYNHLRDDIEYVYNNRLSIDDIDIITKISSIYIRVFDQIPLITDKTSQSDKEFLLLSKKYLGLTLRNDLVLGTRTMMELSRARKELLSNNPNLFEENT